MQGTWRSLEKRTEIMDNIKLGMDRQVEVGIKSVACYSLTSSGTGAASAASSGSASLAAEVARMVTQKISTKSTQRSRFSVGTNPYVMQCASGQILRPLRTRGTVVHFISPQIVSAVSIFIEPNSKRYVLFQTGPQRVWSSTTLGIKDHHCVQPK
jgi:hypothetical protein